MAGQLITQALGSDADYQLTVRDTTGTAITTFTTANALSATCWSGGSSSALFSPTVTWLSAPAGTIQLTVLASATAGLGVGTYRLQVSVASGAKSFLVFDGKLQLTAAPGTASALPVYGSYQDLLLYAPFIEALEADTDLAQFANERHRARTWLENLGQRHFSSNSTYGISATGMGLGGVGPTKTGAFNPYLQSLFDANNLMVKDDVAECVAKKALAYILLPQLGNSSSGTSYQQLGRQFAEEADTLASQLTLNIDTNADGYPEFVIELGSTSTLWG